MDGYGALPIQEKNILETYHFLEMLPTYIKRPDIVPEPSGMIGLEWNSKNLDLVMSVDGKNIIFAVLYADGTSYSGTSKYNEEIPPIILEKIQKVTNDQKDSRLVHEQDKAHKFYLKSLLKMSK